MPTHDYVLSYNRPYKETWTGAFIGVYSSLEQVENAIERLRPKMAFKDYPNGFVYECLRLDEDYDDPTHGTDAK
ncbi:MAG: hypothetical protein HY040_12810 [Planctomycetes bacterium]|nr:hypothetical protein [Planctomycetota bacterium]